MSDTAVEKTQLAEEETEESILANKAKNKETSGQAREEVESLYKELIDQTRDLKRKKTQDMEKQAQEGSQDLPVKTDGQVERLEEMKRQDYPELAKLIVEKVVV